MTDKRIKKLWRDSFFVTVKKCRGSIHRTLMVRRDGVTSPYKKYITKKQVEQTSGLF